MPASLKILVTGANGQVGRALLFALNGLGKITATDRSQLEGSVPHGLDFRLLDLMNLHDLRGFLRQRRPDLIIHPAAYTAVDKAESERDLAMAINRDATGAIGEEAAALGVPVIAFSTDYVFPGDGTKPWVESDQTGPLSTYGATKLAGEAALVASGATHVMLRTSWVFSAHGANFVKTMLRLARERPVLRVVADQFGAPTSAEFLARQTRTVVESGLKSPGFRPIAGTYHLACAGETSWHGFATEIIGRARKLGFPIVTESIEPIATESFPTPANRPKNSRFDCRKFISTFPGTQSLWTDELDFVLRKILPSAK